MTRRARRMLLFGLPAAVVAVAVSAWLLWPRTAITRENADKIRMGMTLAEVEAILGGPARDESTGPLVVILAKDDDYAEDDEPVNAEISLVLLRAAADAARVS
jgi:hypothetical protein